MGSAKSFSANLNSLIHFLRVQKIDGILVNSSDTYLSEYVPLANNFLYHFSGFTGSTGELLVMADGRSYLLVDGRYHEQASKEVTGISIEIVKYDLRQGLSLARTKLMNAKQSWALIAQRISWQQQQTFAKLVHVVLVNEPQIKALFDYSFVLEQQRPIYGLQLAQCGESASNKWARIVPDLQTGLWASTLDTIAWLSNCRGVELPFQSTFVAKALCVQQQLHVFLPLHSQIADNACQSPGIVWHHVLMDNFSEQLKAIQQQLQLQNIIYAPKSITAADFQMLEQIFPQLTINDDLMITQQASKNFQEIAVMVNDFGKSDQAIFQSLQWVKEIVATVPGIKSELDFFQQVNRFYQAAGAIQQSFTTISAIGANSSIIHYSTPSADVKLVPSQLVLLDSGGLYDAGYATDTTRTILSGGRVEAWQQEIYTLVLKALLHLQNAVFPIGTWGAHIDGIGRSILYRAGHNYQHGTGHGIGINVHEGGYNIGLRSQVVLTSNTVGSLEPGIYLPGKGGVRLENVVLVEAHPDYEDMLRFRPLHFIGFDFSLIQMEALELQERRWLMEYEEQCAERGTSFYLLPR